MMKRERGRKINRNEPICPKCGKSNLSCRRIGLNFFALPEPLYEALLDEFRRQFPDYDSSEISWHWDIVASDSQHPEFSIIYQICHIPNLEDIPEEEEYQMDPNLVKAIERAVNQKKSSNSMP